MKIIFFPTDHSTNRYGAIITDGLKKRGIIMFPFEKASNNLKLLKHVQILHLNWYESLGKSTIIDLKRFMGKVFKLGLFKLLRIKIVWTMHNLMPHDQRNIRLKKYLIGIIVRCADKIIIHSKVSRDILNENYIGVDKKIVYIPHPNYIDSYGGLNDQFVMTTSKKLELLFLGAIKPYKNIELLMDVVSEFKNDVVLTIAGKPESLSYKASLIRYAENKPNLVLHFNFIPDSEIHKYVRECDLLVFPYDIKSSLNSGSVIMSFSMGRSVICPEIGTISDLPNYGQVLVYKYRTNEEHFDQLKSAITKAVEMKRTDINIFRNMGMALFDYVKKVHDNDKVINQLIKVYDDLL